MMSTGILLLFLGLIVFGPKKTLEFAQEIGRLAGHLKQTASQVLAGEEIRIPQRTAQAVVNPGAPSNPDPGAQL